MMALVAGVLVATSIATQRSVGATYRRLYEERFADALAAGARLREARLAAASARCLELASSVRLVAAIEENDPEILYRIALDELRDVIRPPGEGRPAAFFRLVGRTGEILPATDDRAGEIESEATLERAFDPESAAVQQVVYVGDPAARPPRVLEVVRTRIVDPVEGVTLGALLVGFVVVDRGEPGAHLLGGFWVGGRLYSEEIPDPLAGPIAETIRSGAAAGPEIVLPVGGVPHRLFTRLVGPERSSSPAYRVALHSMGDAIEEQARLARGVLGIGALALAAALVTSLFLARGLSGPVEALVVGTAEVRRGNFDARVPVRGRGELGRLAEAFNDMAAGLAEKERVRSVLNLVADPAVAAELVDGRAALGGEIREVSVLFCDIRGFTALTEGMAPAEVIAMLNEHMSALTRVVHEHGGVVDKFAGDSLMALFGAPRSSGDDALAAVRAGLGIVAARAALNAGSAHAIEVGVGIASGAVVAGCMGAADRMNYTVLGAQVNLASRLCGKAGRGEVLIDAETALRVRGRIGASALPPLELKGFRAPVPAFLASGADTA